MPSQGGLKQVTEMIPKFGFLGSLQSDSGPSFVIKVTQRLAFGLGIEYLLHAKGKNNKKGK